MLLFLLATRLLAYRRSSADPTDTGTDTGIGMGMSIGMGLSGNSSLENSPKAGPGSSTDSAKFGNGYGYGYSGLYLDTMAGEKRESGGEGYGEDEDEEEVENTFYAASAGTATRAGGWFSGLFSFSEGWSAGKDNETELTSISTGAEGVGVRGGQKGYQSMS